MQRRTAVSADRMLRILAPLLHVLAPLLILVPTVALLCVTTDPASFAAVGAVVLWVALLAVVAVLAAAAGIEIAPTTGPSSEERCLHGRFRRQSNPHTPGRPRPRAPGLGLLPV